MKIFIAGGTGAIGRPLVAELLARGHALVALTRSPEKAQALEEKGIEPAVADASRAGRARQAQTIGKRARQMASRPSVR